MSINNQPDSRSLPSENPLVEIYRDEWLLVAHKPAGLLVHRSPIDRHETEFALQYARAMNGGKYVYPVHRLDRPTSGVLVFARDPQTARTVGCAERKRSASVELVACNGISTDAPHAVRHILQNA